MNVQEQSVCLSRTMISSRNHEGLFPELSCPNLTPSIEPSGFSTLRTKTSVFPLEKSVPVGASSVLLSETFPVLSSEPYISIATLAVVPEFLQTPVIIVISYSCRLFDPVGSSTGEPF